MLVRTDTEAVTTTRLRPAAPVPPARSPGLLKTLRLLYTNPIAGFPQQAYELPVIKLSRFVRGILLISDPAAVEQILITDAANYAKSEQQQQRLRPALGDGLLTAKDETWRTGRRIASPLFNPRAVALLYDDMRCATRAMSERWRRRATTGEPLDLAQEFQRLTYEIVSLTIFSGALDSQRVQLHANMALYFDTLGRINLASMLNLPDWVPSPARRRVRPALAHFRKVVADVVNARVRDSGRGASDLLDRLMHSSDPASGNRLSAETVGDNVLTFLVAGHETTANALAWIFYLLALYPDAEARLRAEVAAMPHARAFDQLPFAHAVVNEALRLYPPVPFIGRQALHAGEVAGHVLAAGAQILISPWVLHRHKLLWDRPDEFIPERFLASAREMMPRGSFIPFGLGPRICIGQGFAVQEIVVVLTELLPAFSFRLADADAVFPQARITLHPRNGIQMIVTERPDGVV